ncbi:MAG: radical SAM protein [Nitrospinales bacterium]
MKDLNTIPDHITTEASFPPEKSPFSTLFVDITHKCNMECLNCYIPNREIPDMDTDWLYDILSRLPQKTYIRLAGAEPTVRKDLPDIIRQIKNIGHHPIVLTNGLKFIDRKYIALLKKSGLRTVHFSFSGGFDRKAYIDVDGMDCLDKKVLALENACAENLFITLGFILVRDINEHTLPAIWKYVADKKPIREFHIRSVGQFGRFTKNRPYTLEQVAEVFFDKTGLNKSLLQSAVRHSNFTDFKVDSKSVQITQWPDLGNQKRGRLAPDGTLQPFFEHIIANEGGY